MQNNTRYIDEEKIDLKELFTVLKKRKKLIWGVTTLLTLLALIYVFVAKPIYSGNVTIEIGEVADEQFNEGKYASLKIRKLDDATNLKNIVDQKFDVSASILKKTTLLTYTATDTNKDIIKEKLAKAIDYTLERHKEKAKLYSGLHSKVNMTHLIKDITVADTAIKPKKKLIVIMAFIAGLMLSVFLAFFLEFINGLKKEDEETRV